MYEQPGRRAHGHSHGQRDAPLFQPTEDYAHDVTGSRPYVPLDALDPLWDPAEELARLLREPVAPAQWEAAPAGADGVPDASGPARPPADLEQITAELPPVRATAGNHRRAPRRKRVTTVLQTVSVCTAALAAVIVSMVSVYGGMVTYAPLRHAAGPRTSDEVVRWWPLLVYGPWMVASLSVLRAAFHQRRAVHSWSVILLFSTIAMTLCVAQAPRTFSDAAAAALPAVAALACFQQLVRQITLTRPPRQAAPRHRNVTAPPTITSG